MKEAATQSARPLKAFFVVQPLQFSFFFSSFQVKLESTINLWPTCPSACKAKQNKTKTKPKHMCRLQDRTCGTFTLLAPFIGCLEAEELGEAWEVTQLRKEEDSRKKSKRGRADKREESRNWISKERAWNVFIVSMCGLFPNLFYFSSIVPLLCDSPVQLQGPTHWKKMIIFCHLKGQAQKHQWVHEKVLSHVPYSLGMSVFTPMLQYFRVSFCNKND